MHNDAPIVLAEWAAQANAETRRLMGVSVAPEIPERQEARAYLSGLLSDEEAAAARVAADLERVRALCGPPPDEEDDDGWPREAWAAAARDYRKDRRPGLARLGGAAQIGRRCDIDAANSRVSPTAKGPAVDAALALPE